jgi:hypothetical protein
MCGVKSSVIKKCLMLFHSCVKGNVIILNPTTKRVEEEDWVLISDLEELVSCFLKEEDMTIVEWVSKLESEYGISVSFLDLIVNLFWCLSVLIHTIVEFNLSDESHVRS